MLLRPLYTPEFLANLEQAISTERLRRYLAATNNNLAAALELYEYNVTVSEALFGILHSFEVTVRNSIHSTLSGDLKVIDWYQSGIVLPWSKKQEKLVFPKPTRDIIATARNQAGPGASIGKLVAELSFGFWSNITASTFDYLWTPSLHKAFSHAHVPRRFVHWRLEIIRRLRNRIAHHEPILSSQNKVYTGFKDDPYIALPHILECVQWVSPDAAYWLQTRSRYAQAETLLMEISKSGISL